jgi:hypothetical protein
MALPLSHNLLPGYTIHAPDVQALAGAVGLYAWSKKPSSNHLNTRQVL